MRGDIAGVLNRIFFALARLPAGPEKRAPTELAMAGVLGYGAVAALDTGLRLSVLPLVTRAVSLETFTHYALIVVSMPLLVILADLGTGNAIVRYAPRASSERERARWFASLAWTRIAGASTVAVLGLGAVLTVEAALDGAPPGDLPGWPGAGPLALAVAACAAKAGAKGLVDAMRAEGRHREAALLLLGPVIVTPAVTIGWVVFADGGLLGLTGALLAGQLASVLGGTALRWRDLGARPDLGMVRRLVRFGLPMSLYALFYVGRDMDRHLVRAPIASRSAGLAGVYHLASIPGYLLTLVEQAVQLAYEPLIFGLDRGGLARLLDPLMRTYALLLMWAACAVSALAPEVVSLLAPPSYAMAAEVIPLLTFAVVLHNTFRFLGSASGALERTSLLALGALAEVTFLLTVIVAAGGWGGLLLPGAARVGGASLALLTCRRLLRRSLDGPVAATRVVALGTGAAALFTWLVAEAPEPFSGLPVRLASGVLVGVVAHLAIRPRRP